MINLEVKVASVFINKSLKQIYTYSSFIFGRADCLFTREALVPKSHPVILKLYSYYIYIYNHAEETILQHILPLSYKSYIRDS
jgi:hypothetical protein